MTNQTIICASETKDGLIETVNRLYSSEYRLEFNVIVSVSTGIAIPGRVSVDENKRFKYIFRL